MKALGEADRRDPQMGYWQAMLDDAVDRKRRGAGGTLFEENRDTRSREVANQRS